jgi:PAS domain S-box-containing protein
MQLHGFSPQSRGIDLQGAFTLLARNTVHDRPLDGALRALTEATARMLIVERVSLWAITPDLRSIECLDLFEMTENRHSSGATLSADQYPAYFAGLRREEMIVADDPGTHPCTHEFRNDYLAVHGITAILDTPIHVRNELQGVLCIEQVGAHSGWTPVQRMFAAAAANLVSLALVQDESSAAQEELRETNTRLRALFVGSRDAIVIADADSGRIVDLNPAAERLFGREREELLGQPQTALHPPEEATFYRHLFTEHVRSYAPTPVPCEVVNADGRNIAVEISAEVVELGNGDAIIQGIFRPLTSVNA